VGGLDLSRVLLQCKPIPSLYVLSSVPNYEKRLPVHMKHSRMHHRVVLVHLTVVNI
jgi:hypothetical protein